MNISSTIAAISTPPGAGAVSIIRLSGPAVLAVLGRVFCPAGRAETWLPRLMRYGRVIDPDSGGLLDEALAVWFPGPHSFTGEDCAEIQGHGGPAVTAAVLAAALRAGAVLAQPGEFTRRAYENGRLDISQAEAVADLIGARSAAESALAARHLAGGLSQKVAPIQQAVETALVELTADIDFSDDLEPLDLIRLKNKIQHGALEPLAKLQADGLAGRPFRDGVFLALAGVPNVGKSSLFNALADGERALVSPVAGTTRDYVTTTAVVEGLHLELCDTAGLSLNPADELDSLGQERSRGQMARADLVLWVRDAAQPVTEDNALAGADLPFGKTIAVWNKADLLAGQPFNQPGVLVSARTGQGLDELKRAIVQMAVGQQNPAPPEIVPSLRHQAALAETEKCLRAVVAAIDEGQLPDVCAFELKAALDALGQICGRSVPDDILNKIFSRFCLGK